jgi:hypothetical protein
MKHNLNIEENYCGNCKKYECICYAREIWRMFLVVIVLILLFIMPAFIQSLIWTFS